MNARQVGRQRDEDVVILQDQRQRLAAHGGVHQQLWPLLRPQLPLRHIRLIQLHTDSGIPASGHNVKTKEFLYHALSLSHIKKTSPNFGHHSMTEQII